MEKLLTLVLIHRDHMILLGMKKRGFGQGKWNGFGGKVMEGESIEEAAKRECQEEAGVVPTDMQHVGELRFTFVGGDTHHVHVFSANSFDGNPHETEEMKPQWFSVSEIPYTNMWEDDKYWLPLLLSGKSFNGTFHFDEENKLTEYTVMEHTYA